MKVYLVTKSFGCMVGIETVRIVKVPAAKENAFKKQYAGRILATGTQVKAVAATLGLSFSASGS